MNKITICLMAACLSLSFLPLQSHATGYAIPSSVVSPEPVESPEATALIERLDEIKAMDKSELNHSEKKALRREVRDIKKDLNENHGGVYISVGGALLILLLLVILL